MIKSYNRFNFGKYRGMTAEEVAIIEPGYIYFVENRMGYRFTPKVKRIARKESAFRRYENARARRNFSSVDLDEGLFSSRFSRSGYFY